MRYISDLIALRQVLSSFFALLFSLPISLSVIIYQQNDLLPERDIEYLSYVTCFQIDHEIKTKQNQYKHSIECCLAVKQSASQPVSRSKKIECMQFVVLLQHCCVNKRLKTVEL